jgi:hypothetical protein
MSAAEYAANLFLNYCLGDAADSLTGDAVGLN